MNNVFEKIKEKLEECKERYDDIAFAKMTENGHTLDEVTKIIDQVAKEYNNGWIPVKERLPEKDGYYLTCDAKGNIHVFYHHKSMEYPFSIMPTHPQYYQPVAWQPLPPAYKQKEEVQPCDTK